jgi:hypothetical protein
MGGGLQHTTTTTTTATEQPEQPLHPANNMDMHFILRGVAAPSASKIIKVFEVIKVTEVAEVAEVTTPPVTAGATTICEFCLRRLRRASASFNADTCRETSTPPARGGEGGGGGDGVPPPAQVSGSSGTQPGLRSQPAVMPESQ